MGLDDKFDAKTDTAGGKFKETAGKLTDNERLEAEGRGDQAQGGLKDAAADAKDAARKVGDSIKDAFRKD